MNSKSHANKHKLVTFLSTDKQKTDTQRITNDHVSVAKSRVETREILPPAQTHTMDSRSERSQDYARKQSHHFLCAEVRETGMGWCTHVRAGKNDIFFECSHRLKRRKYQHSADQIPFRIKKLVSRK